MRRWASVGSLGVAVGGLVACSGVGHVPVQLPSAQTTTVTVAGNCPPTLGKVGDVAKQSGLPSKHLLPSGLPSAGLICDYAPSPDGVTPVLKQTVRLTSANAQKLATAIAQISLKPPSGAFHCPADGPGATIIALAYAGNRGVDLWYTTSGCRTLDNGDVSAFEGANASFYTGFENVFNSLARPPAP